MKIIRPGNFSTIATADEHRHSFDVKNEVLHPLALGYDTMAEILRNTLTKKGFDL